MARAPRAATAAFGVLLAVAAAVYALQGRAQWFFQDEWVFFTERDAGSVHGLFAPHNEHWVTLPVLVYRLLWDVVGARRYEPYQAMTIAAHLAVVALLHVLLRRRLGVAPWVAVAASTPLLFTSVGAENVVWAFQISFGGSLVAGLALLLLADHPNPSRARRAAALACGLVALMCSGVGMVMVAVTGLALLVRRGWKPAVATAVPLAAVYGTWLLAFGAGTNDATGDVGLIVRFVRAGMSRSLRGLGPGGGAAGLVVLVALAGTALVAWGARRSPEALRRRLGIPLAMASGAVAFFVLTGITRGATQGLTFATRGRYAYAATVLLLPLVAVGADEVIRRSPVMTAPVLALLVAAVPANVVAIDVRANVAVPPVLVTATAASPALDDAPADLHPFDGIAGFSSISAGWLRQQVADGRVPTDGATSPYWEAEAIARLTVEVGAPWSGTPACHPIAAEGEQVELTADEPVAYVGQVSVQVVGRHGGRSHPRPAGALEPRTIATVGDPVTVLVLPRPGVWAASLCR